LPTPKPGTRANSQTLIVKSVAPSACNLLSRPAGRPRTSGLLDSRQEIPACYAFAVQVSEILRMLQQDGWALIASRGSHRQFKHASKPGRVTVPGKPSDDLAPGTQNSILKQAGLKQ
jgi:predicted RNA binding protein YcfA (HicA-like mRNA interferase family)